MAPEQFFSTARLHDLGLDDRDIARAVAERRLIRLRRGRFSTPDAPTDVAAAVRAGGALSCVSALQAHGAWVLKPEQPHVRVARGVAVGAGVRLHWSDERKLADSPLDDPETSLALAVQCQPFRAAVVAADSVVNRKILELPTVEALLRRTAPGRRVLESLDPLSESGLETLARLSLRSRRIRVRSQVTIVGVGRVDLVIGDRLVLELDGESFHQDFDKDRARDRALILAGYLPIRVSYRQLMHGWAEVEAQLLELIRRDEHLRRPLAMW